MKKIFTIIVALFVATFVGSAAIVTTNLTEAEFETVFDYNNSDIKSGSDAVWFAQIQPGNPSTTSNSGEQWEIEVGNGSTKNYGHTTWTGLDTYSFSVQNSGGNTINATFNSSTTPGGVAVTNPFNEIWIGLDTQVLGSQLEEIEISNHASETIPLSGMTVTGYPQWTGFKYHFDDRLTNVGSFLQSGDMRIWVDNANGNQETFTYTVVGVHNSAIVPEPANVALI